MWDSLRGGCERFFITDGGESVALATRKGKLKLGTTWDYELKRNMMKNSTVGKNFVRTVYRLSRRVGPPFVALITYKWHCEPYHFIPLPHGNQKKDNQPYYASVAHLKFKSCTLLFWPSVIQQFV